MPPMQHFFYAPKEKPYFWLGLGIGLLSIAILRSYLG
jgi:hypothetical protein